VNLRAGGVDQRAEGLAGRIDSAIGSDLHDVPLKGRDRFLELAVGATIDAPIRVTLPRENQKELDVPDVGLHILGARADAAPDL